MQDKLLLLAEVLKSLVEYKLKTSKKKAISLPQKMLIRASFGALPEFVKDLKEEEAKKFLLSIGDIITHIVSDEVETEPFLLHVQEVIREYGAKSSA